MGCLYEEINDQERMESEILISTTCFDPVFIERIDMLTRSTQCMETRHKNKTKKVFLRN